MTKFEQWIDLGKQKRQARRIMRDKQSELLMIYRRPMSALYTVGGIVPPLPHLYYRRLSWLRK